MKGKGTAISEARRHWTVAILLQLGIRLKYLYLQWFGLKPFLLGCSSRPAMTRPKSAPKYDLISRIGFVLIWSIIAATREWLVVYGVLCKIGVIGLITRVHNWLANRLIAQMKAQGWDGKNREIPLPEFDWKNRTPEEFYNLYVKIPHPVVLRGFMKDNADLLKQLSWNSVLNSYAEEDVILTKPEKDGYPGKLKEVDQPKTYLHNSEILFTKYPELRELFKYETLEPYIKRKVGYEQIFVGREGTGTPFHRASNWNFFYMIDGRKRWWFVDPIDTCLTYPVIRFGKAAQAAIASWPNEGNMKELPLFNYAPVYTCDLDPGDVIFNPPWWWHAIKNISPTTVAVASRWHNNGICGDDLMMTEEDYEVDRWASMAFFAGFDSWSFLHEILQTPSPRYDEHLTLREKNNRFADKQSAYNKRGGIEFAGVVAKM